MTQREYRHTTTRIRVYDVGVEPERLLDEWNVLTGLSRCVSCPLEDREEYAQALALTWAVAISREHEIEVEA